MAFGDVIAHEILELIFRIKKNPNFPVICKERLLREKRIGCSTLELWAWGWEESFTLEMCCLDELFILIDRHVVSANLAQDHGTLCSDLLSVMN